MNILALDMATKTGFAVAIDGKRKVSGTWRNPELMSADPGAFFVRFYTWLIDMKSWHEPNLIAYEFTPHMRSIAASAVHLGMVAHLQAFAHRHKIPLCCVYPNTLKKVSTGNGRAEKEAMEKSARRFWNWRGTDEDEADALCLLHWAVHREGEG